MPHKVSLIDLWGEDIEIPSNSHISKIRDLPRWNVFIVRTIPWSSTNFRNSSILSPFLGSLSAYSITQKTNVLISRLFEWTPAPIWLFERAISSDTAFWMDVNLRYDFLNEPETPIWLFECAQKVISEFILGVFIKKLKGEVEVIILCVLSKSGKVKSYTFSLNTHNQIG